MTLSKWLQQRAKDSEGITPLPWVADLGNWQIECANPDSDSYRDGICCFTHDDRDCVNGEPNKVNPVNDAEFIESACSNYDTLVVVAQRLLKALEKHSCCQMCEPCPGCTNFDAIRDCEKLIKDGK